jgi:molybdopterin synthase sulfur carrier subunit
MQVTCELYATVRDAVGRKRVSRTVEPGTTVRDLLRALGEEYDGVGPLVFDAEERVRANVNVLVNGEPIRSLAGPETELSDGDTLMVSPSVAGG